ncbi:hypothetical protein E2C01_080288 [Portunus trituberculatus]|uniref:Uncharacterized protein n=1 Tax=Portunus trituberculatus TaxID=210409 RepID=A0A5B7ITP6_PORTR|nr:hypothetical protein [Portunus trituberculatus]
MFIQYKRTQHIFLLSFSSSSSILLCFPHATPTPSNTKQHQATPTHGPHFTPAAHSHHKQRNNTSSFSRQVEPHSAVFPYGSTAKIKRIPPSTSTSTSTTLHSVRIQEEMRRKLCSRKEDSFCAREKEGEGGREGRGGRASGRAIISNKGKKIKSVAGRKVTLMN